MLPALPIHLHAHLTSHQLQLLEFGKPGGIFERSNCHIRAYLQRQRTQPAHPLSVPNPCPRADYRIGRSADLQVPQPGDGGEIEEIGIAEVVSFGKVKVDDPAEFPSVGDVFHDA